MSVGPCCSVWCDPSLVVAYLQVHNWCLEESGEVTGELYSCQRRSESYSTLLLVPHCYKDEAVHVHNALQ